MRKGLIACKSNVGARAFKVGRRLNLKVGGPKYFIDFSPEKACRA